MKGITEENVGKLLRWYAKQPEAVRIDVHKKRYEVMNSWQNAKRARGEKAIYAPDIEYSAFVVAIKKVQRMFDNRQLTADDDLEEITRARIDAIKNDYKVKPAPIKNKLVDQLQPVMVKLRNEGLSWEKISDYIALHHKKRISRGYLRRVFAEIQADIQLQEVKVCSG